jgi:hypothetical protein
VPVAFLRGLAPEIVPLFDRAVAAPETHQRDQIDLLLFGQGIDEAGDLARHGIAAIVLKHIDHVVVGSVRPGIWIGVGLLDVEFTGFHDQKTNVFGRNG